MRYIDIDKLEVGAPWLEKARQATELLRHASPADRQSLLKDKENARIWGDLKSELLKLSSGKCWYCETKEIRSDNAVDHYRPKGNVRGVLPPHEGYWWLAFDWRNYRFTCAFCNSARRSPTTDGGKQDFFPLWDEERRARSESDDLDSELPLLLDPTKVRDIGLLAFSDDGGVGPAMSESRKREFRSADESIRRYHLHHPFLVERRMSLLRQVSKWIDQADKQLDRYARTDDPIAYNEAENRINDIRRAAAQEAEYSAAVRHLLAGRVSSESAQQVLRTL